MSSSGTYKIRPAGRHILTIGRDLIQDSYAAVVELVKNAYDADSPDVSVEFRMDTDQKGYSVIVKDHGHGMSHDVVTGTWMVPSTQDKLNRKNSPSGRVMQGRKGVGRYAASILGDDLLLETITQNGELTTLFLEWECFESADFLDDVEILIENTKTNESPGTTLTMHQARPFGEDWDDKQLRKLRYELKKLKSPMITSNEIDDEFKIKLVFTNHPGQEDSEEIIEPYPILELYDYRIWGKISTAGNGLLKYSQQRARNSIEETIKIDIGKTSSCGELDIDIRVFDREKDAIDSLIQRGLKDEKGDYVGKLEARRILNEYNGVGVYRNGFRIRPLGDADFDWLKLNEQRVQNPSMRIGSNQVIGFVSIQSEEKSGLEEKSARDGLKENKAYEALKDITINIIRKLEERRFEYRSKSGLSRSSLKIEQEIEKLFSYEDLKEKFQKKLQIKKIDQDVIDDLFKDFEKDSEEKNKAAEEIRQAVAIYQGQATLGKIINVILHEGRRPLSYFRNQIPRIRKKVELFQKNQTSELANELKDITDGVGNNAENFVSLFSRLDPLASGKRPKRKELSLTNEIVKAIDIFKPDDRYSDVNWTLTGDDIIVLGWSQDIVTVFSNLIENSLYWMESKSIVSKNIEITISKDQDSFWIDYRDSGPGIEPDLIRRNIIFEPHFSTKPEGTGLGLSIAGEAVSRFGMTIKALESDMGAYFRIEQKEI